MHYNGDALKIVQSGLNIFTHPCVYTLLQIVINGVNVWPEDIIYVMEDHLALHESGPQGLVSCSRHSLWDALQLKCMSLDLKDWCLVADIHYGMHFN